MNKKLKYVFIFILLLAAFAAAGNYFFFTGKDGETVFTTDRVRRGEIENLVLTNGVLYPSKLVDVGSQVSGMIEKITVKLGEQVEQGELIAQIDSLTQQNALKEAQASLNIINAQHRAKQAQIRSAISEFKRQKKMLADGASSQSAYDNAEATLMVYQAELEQLNAEQEKSLISVDDAQLNLGYTKIAAPIDGTVVYISVEQGQTVNNNQGTPSIVELAQLKTMTIKAEVSEADVIHVQPGQQVYFSILGAPNKKYQAVLRAIEPGPTLMTGDDSDLKIGNSDAIYYNALFDVDNPDNLLRIGMTAQVSIILDRAENALLVPAQVLVAKGKRKKGYQVAVKNGDSVEYRDVKVGINNKIYAQILSGLSEGDEIIIGESIVGQSSVSSLRAANRQQRMRL